MSEKILNNRELAQVKRIAQNVDADYQKVCKLCDKIAELTREKEELQRNIDEMEAPVIRKTGGFRSTDIFMKTVIPQFNEDGTPKVDKEGRQIKVTKYILAYPDTIIPCNCGEQANIEVPSTEGLPGSDFDVDVANNLNV